LNIGESKQLALDLIIESIVNGIVVPSARNNDYLLLHNTLANSAQIEIAQIKKIHAKYSITQNPIDNQLGKYQGFDIVQHLDTDITDMQATGSRAYYFEVDNDATIYFEEYTGGAWVSIKTSISHVGVGGFTAYKGLLSPSSVVNDVRVRFGGNYPYNVRNRALYAYTFSSVANIPDYTPYVSYILPADFMELNKVVYRGDTNVYDNYMGYKWEGRKTIVLSYYDAGSFDILYFKYPTAITSASLDTVEFEVDAEAQQLIPLYVASKWVAEEKPTMSAILFNEYRLKLSQLSDVDVIGDNTIYSMDGW